MRRPDRHTRRMAAAVILGVALVGGAAYAVHAVASERHGRMQAAAAAAQADLRAARAEDAVQWASSELEAAERATYEALALHRAEEVRLWPIPSADPVVQAWASAQQAARLAARRARDLRAAAANSAGAQIEEARVAVSAAGTLASRIHLGPERQLLSQARLALDQALAYERGGDLQAARDRAGDAVALAAKLRDHAAGIAGRYADADNIARWQRWKQETIARSKRERRAAILVVKDAHRMTLYVAGEPVRTYTVELGFNWVADKRQEGDGATPEGRYRVVKRKDKSASKYHKALLIDYPNAEDRAEFRQDRQRGDLHPSARIGGLIEIHGGGGRAHDWTDGCVAVTDAEIDDLFPRVAVGTPVTIIGSDQYGSIAELADRTRRDSAGRRP